MHVKTGYRDLSVAALIAALLCVRPYWGATLFVAFFIFIFFVFMVISISSGDRSPLRFSAP